MATEIITENGIKYLQSNPLNQITVNGVDYELDLKVNLSNFIHQCSYYNPSTFKLD